MQTFTTSQGQEFTIAYAYPMPSGFGHKKINVQVCSEDGTLKDFCHTTSNMPNFDEALEKEGQEKWDALFEIVENDLDGEISEWLYELDSED